MYALQTRSGNVMKVAMCTRSSHVFDQGGCVISTINGGDVGADQAASVPAEGDGLLGTESRDGWMWSLRRRLRMRDEPSAHMNSLVLFPETRTQDSSGGPDEDGDGGEELAPTHGGGEEAKKVEEEEEELQWKGPGLFCRGWGWGWGVQTADAHVG